MLGLVLTKVCPRFDLAVFEKVGGKSPNKNPPDFLPKDLRAPNVLLP